MKIQINLFVGVMTTLALAACNVATATPAPKPAATSVPPTMAAPTVAPPTAAPTAIPAIPTAVPVAAKKIVASTSWVGAFAKAAGASDISVIAPANLQHPPDYDPKPSDLVNVAKADFILVAGYEGFAKRMHEAVGGDAKKIITVNTENSPEVIRKEVTRLAEVFKTQDKAKAWLDNFDKEYGKLSGDLKAKARIANPTIVSQVFVTPWLAFSGLQSAGCYGPNPITPAQLKILADLKPNVVFENAHMGGGDPVVEASKAKKVLLINFPSDQLDLLEVFKINSQRISDALPTTVASIAAHTGHGAAPGCVASSAGDHAAMGHGDAPSHGAVVTNTHAATTTGHSHGAAMTQTHPAASINATTTQAANVFGVSVAQYYLDSAGFHDMATTLSNTQKIDTGYITKINHVNKMLTQTAWGPALQGKAAAFVATANKLVEALAAGKVKDAVMLAAKTHDDQHALSHDIDHWLASKPVKAAAADPFSISVSQYLLDNAGFHDMATTLSNTQKINTAYLTTINRVKKVFVQTAWDKSFEAKAQKFMTSLDKLSEALAAGNVKDAVQWSGTVHDEQHVLSHDIDHWLEHKPTKAAKASLFDISVAQYVLDVTGFHDMATTLSNTQKIDTGYITKINRAKKIFVQITWGDKLDLQAQTFIGTLGKYVEALAAGNVKDAVKVADLAHDQQHALSHEIDAWVKSQK